MITIQEIIASADALPTLSDTVVKISELISSPHSDISDFEAVVRPDPALTANLLKIANSSYFGLPREVTSVRQAITLLGAKRVFELAAGASFVKILPDTIPGYNLEAPSFWKHCVAVAMMAERISKKLGKEPPDLTFTAGLLHDIGKLVIGNYIVEHSHSILPKIYQGSISLVEVEKEYLGLDHTEVGEAIIEQWNLPKALGEVARWHHNPMKAPEGLDSQTIIDLIHAANGLAHSFGFGADVGEMMRKVDSDVVRRLGIKTQQLEIVASETLDEIRNMGEIMSTNFGE